MGSTSGNRRMGLSEGSRRRRVLSPTWYVFLITFFSCSIWMIIFLRLLCNDLYPVRVGNRTQDDEWGSSRRCVLSPSWYILLLFTFFPYFTKRSLLSDYGWLQTNLPTSHANNRQWTRLEIMVGIMPRLRKVEPKKLCYTLTNTTLLSNIFES